MHSAVRLFSGGDVCLCPEDVCVDGGELRDVCRRLWRDIELRDVHGAGNVRGRRNAECVRLYADDELRGAGKELRIDK